LIEGYECCLYCEDHERECEGFHDGQK
jgi:hypothetical protein